MPDMRRTQTRRTVTCVARTDVAGDDVGNTGAVLDLESLRDRVHKNLVDFIEQQTPQLDDISDDLSPLIDAISSLLSKGKRLRAAFCYWGWRGAGRDDCEEVVRAASSLELLQACALIHDDVMDRSETRRGQPTAHRRFAALHRGSSWLGSPDEFGVGAAVLLGDLCLAWSDELFFTSGLESEPLLRAKPIFDVMRTELMSGQYLDLLEQVRGGGSVPRAMRVVRYKAAKYTVERPLHLGGTLAGADQRLLAVYSRYGLPLGEAFQLRDDVLGVFGDPATTGKPAGDDIREGKRTVLVALAVERASPAQTALLRRHLGDPGLSEDGVEDLRATIRDTGALEEVEALISSLTSTALDALQDVPPPAREPLAALAIAATSRTV